MSGDLPILFTMPGTCALSVEIALRWAGADYELRVLAHGENRGPAFLAINPAGQVPAMMLEGEPVLTEVHALLLLVADSHPESGLAPPSSRPMPRYRLEELLAFMTGEVHDAFLPLFAPERFGDGEAGAAAVRDAALGRIQPLLKRLDARLGAKAYVLGERTVADAYLYVLARWASHLEEGLAAMPNLARFRAALEADPAVVATLGEHGMGLAPASRGAARHGTPVIADRTDGGLVDHGAEGATT